MTTLKETEDEDDTGITIKVKMKLSDRIRKLEINFL